MESLFGLDLSPHQWYTLMLALVGTVATWYSLAMILHMVMRVV